MLEKVREAVRVDGKDLDNELLDLIAACKADLMLSGVINYKEDDALIIQATKTYAKAHFDVSNPDFDKLIASYESLKTHLSLTEEYTVKPLENI